MTNSNFQYNPYNPYINPYNPVGSAAGNNSLYQSAQRQEIIKVNGREGANAYPLPANSSVLLLDINQPIIFLKQADGGGYCSTTAYTITPYEQDQKPVVDMTDLEKRIKRLEELYESNITVTTEQLKQSKSSQSNPKH